MHTMIDILSIYFKDIEYIESRIDNKRVKLSMVNTNRIQVLKSFHVHNERMGTLLNMNDCLNLEHKTFTNFRLSYKEKEYSIDAKNPLQHKHINKTYNSIKL